MFTPHITSNKMANTCYEKQLYESFIVLYDNIEKKTLCCIFRRVRKIAKSDY
jgi:hypothetical protein